MDEPLIDERIARAGTLPSRWYWDAAFLDLERDRVFGRTWQLAALASRVGRPGAYLTAEIAGEPLLIARGEDSRLRAMSNVCRHRAGPVARGEGCRRAFQCGYHGWTYSLDGRLLSVPEFEGVEAFEPDKVRLPEARVEAWGPFIFVNLDMDAEPLESWMGEIIARSGHVPIDEVSPVERREYVVECNWKVYVDNYLEGYHLPIVHPSLFRELDYDAYRTDLYTHGSLQIAPIRRGAGGGPRRYDAPEDQGRDALYFWVFPNLMLNVYPDNLSTNLILPLGHGRTLTIFEWFFRDPASEATRERVRRTVAFSDEIQREDIAICEAVWKGLNSRTYDRGRFSPRRESGVHQFHLLMERFLGDLRPGG